MATLHKFNGEEIIATELPSLLNQNFDYVNDNRIKTVNNVGYDENNNIDVTHLVTQSIQSGTDLNNLTTSGEYIRLGSVTKLLNSPSESPFFLTVLSSNNLVKQVLTELIANNPATFTRTMNSANWSPWIESGANIGTWESNEQVKVGDVRYLGGRENTGYILECVQAGTTGDSQPTVSKSDIDNSTDLEGFSGTLQIAHGGHGANTVEGARANLGLSYATQSQAEAGVDNATVMTPLRTKQLGDSNYLPLSGGYMKGDISMGGNDIKVSPTNNASSISIFGGTGSSDGGIIRANGINKSSDAGKVQFAAVTASGGRKWFNINPDGTCTWNNSEVITQTALDSQKPIKEYTATTQLGLTNNATELEILNAMPAQSIYQSWVSKAKFPNLSIWNYQSDNSRLRLTRVDSNSFIIEVFSPSSINAQFFAVANTDSTGVKYQRVATNGALSMPVVDNEISIDKTTTNYTAPTDGWFCVRAVGVNSTNNILTLAVNTNRMLHRHIWNTNNTQGLVMPMAKGAICSIELTSCSISEMYFIPAQSEV